MNNYKLIIFDFDGTLADSFPWFADNINKAASLFRFNKVQVHEHETLREYNARQVMNYLDISWWKVPLIAVYMRKLMKTEISKINLFEQTHLLLQQLKEKNIQLAIVSSNSFENVKVILGDQSSGLITFYECGTSMFGKSKKFEKLLKKTGFGPDEILCIGDEIRDIEAARDLNMHAGAVTWGFARTHALVAQRPEHLFQSMEDILRAIRP